ncbi:rod outer segment membrane protein 1 [Ornithorhynchus anatinus]|uniref:rod outer segment membrane protein 1 n=1 Tax=Ornithorhynchus anatinus TaxID=9258 RepID=UPI0010A7EE8A|nr:rod outer segment membrane protein 1 [Ornithorhynchus anatinus]
MIFPSASYSALHTPDPEQRSGAVLDGRNPRSPRPCLRNHLSELHGHPGFDPHQLGLDPRERGCRPVLPGHLRGLTGTPRSLPLTCPLQGSALLGLRYLQTALEGSGAAVDGEARGFPMPRGLREMLRSARPRGARDNRLGPEEAPPEEAAPEA